MKENNVDISHLYAIRSAFLSCERKHDAFVNKRKLFKKLAELNLQFPSYFLKNIILDIKVNKGEEVTDEDELSYEKLNAVIQIYNHCPARLKGDNNNSDCFKASLDYN
jgi:Ca2+-binding EF-hand superfamily protein